MSDAAVRHVQCCIVGGGPAGMMLAALLARSGIHVLLLEKHADFFRDFRGDTIHPSTLELLHELGLLQKFLQLPHQEIETLWLDLNGRRVQGPDFSHLPTKCRFVALAPQWDFLNFLKEWGSQFSTFELMMNAEVTGYTTREGRVNGVTVQTLEGSFEVTADLVVAADGRGSILRQQSQLEMIELGAPIDVLWYRIPKPAAMQGVEGLGHITNGRMLVTLDRGSYLQCATVIRKGDLAAVQAAGLAEFRANILSMVPQLSDTVSELQSWDQVKLLNVQMNRLKQWYLDGLLLIGDAAHAMSPVGGVGVNLAIQDAVATANILADKLRAGRVDTDVLRKVQDRREWPAKMTQRMQAFAHHRIFNPKKGFGQTFIFSAFARHGLGLIAPVLRRTLARIVGIGFRPEHIETQEWPGIRRADLPAQS